jgi:hypothetical protein
MRTKYAEVVYRAKFVLVVGNGQNGAEATKLSS